MIEVIWNSLLELRRLLSSCDNKNFSVQIVYRDNNFHIQVGIADEGQKPQVIFNFGNSLDNSGSLKFSGILKFCWDEDFNIQLQNEITNHQEFKFINTYLPYCFSTLKSHKLKRTYGISHYAQSLDGKIATVDGKSKWISDQENLNHSHRMRAMCDSILIGINTLRNDKPRLDVRHVKGNNPVKVVIGNSSASFSSLMLGKEKIIFLHLIPQNYCKVWIRF
ncbi:MAG: hypothetical protein HC905_31475 [Bacteroidales bacterium]|nr:hypothetical protein [Bacteroidales bacterium]